MLDADDALPSLIKGGNNSEPHLSCTLRRWGIAKYPASCISPEEEDFLNALDVTEALGEGQGLWASPAGQVPRQGFIFNCDRTKCFAWDRTLPSKMRSCGFVHSATQKKLLEKSQALYVFGQRIARATLRSLLENECERIRDDAGVVRLLTSYRGKPWGYSSSGAHCFLTVLFGTGHQAIDVKLGSSTSRWSMCRGTVVIVLGRQMQEWLGTTATIPQYRLVSTQESNLYEEARFRLYT